jgi:hypothetical protein
MMHYLHNGIHSINTRTFVHRSQWACAVLIAMLTSTLAPTRALANGRFPATNQLHIAQNTDGSRTVLLRTTFGVLLSRDEGLNWDWICERSMGYPSIPQDPPFAIAQDGTIFGGTFNGLTVSRDNGCAFTFPKGDLGESSVIDLTVTGFDRKRAYFLTNRYASREADNSFRYDSRLYTTMDNGASFGSVGRALDPTLVFHTLDATTSDRARLYLSATRTDRGTLRGVLLTSRDAGQSFAESPIPLIADEDSVFIAAVDPTRADRVYFRTAGGPDTPGRLLLSEDSGVSYKEILKISGALRGFALSPNGETVWAGGQATGLYRASTQDFAFTKIANIQVQCLYATATDLWACSNEASGFIAGRSTDNGASFVPKLRLAGVRGPLMCAAGTSTAACATEWPRQRAELGGQLSPADAGGTADSGRNDVAPVQLAHASGGCSEHASPLGTGSATLVVTAATLFARFRRKARAHK